MALREELLQSFESVRRTGRQIVPDVVQKALLHYADTPDNEKTLNGMIALLTRHTEMLNNPHFKFTELRIRWPQQANKPLYHYEHALYERNLNTQMLAKDGVAIYLAVNKDAKGISFNMEDMKGRIQTLAQFELQRPGVHKINIMDGTTTVLAVDARLHSDITSPHSDELKNRLQKVLQKSILVTVPLMQLDRHKDLWFCRKEGIPTQLSGSNLIPIHSSSSSPSVHAQINKIDPGLVNYLSNAARRGPTMNTIETIYRSAMERSESPLSGETFIDAIKNATQQIKPAVCQADIPSSFIKWADDPNLSHDERSQRIAHGLLATGVMFDKKATSNRIYNSIDTPTMQRNTSSKTAKKKHGGNNSNASIGNDSKELRSTFEHYHGALTAEQLTQKMLKTLQPSGPLPVSADDIQTLNQIVNSMQRSPKNAEHGLNWFEGIVRDRQLALIEHPAPERSSAPTNERTRGPRRR